MTGTIDFAARKITSPEFFRPLFDEGMSLVAESAAYLDGQGRAESAGLPPGARLSYLAISMRLVAVLTQFASWLMLHRAIQEGEIDFGTAATDARRPKVAELGILADLPGRSEVPESLNGIIDRIERLRVRLDTIERALYGEPASAFPNPVLQRIALIEAAFARS